jgi:hypothetical protein
MRRKISIVLLALGTLGGYASGFASLRCRADHRRADFERHVAALCVDAARGADAAPAVAAPGRPAAAAGDSSPAP